MSGARHDGADPGGHGYLGPIEPAEGTEAPPPPPLPLHRLLSGRQKIVLAVLFASVVVVLTLRHPARDPQPPPAADPPPVPSVISRLSYAGPAAPPGGPGQDFALRVAAEADGPYDVVAVRQSYPGLSVTVRGGLPVTVRPEQPVLLTVEYRVTDCAGAPPDAGMPFLDVTLRNTRAIQTISQILGPRYARDLSERLHSACPISGYRTGVSAPAATDSHVR
ncbi:Tat pathway signal sequence domain protein [Kitasatospora sp. NPDC085879]|uniref:Tat pathway signal sequence domain protein n=1 Tax=Kitasatospora sp. NPDC085879 TaxID=3154769 RepID=UPI00344878D3